MPLLLGIDLGTSYFKVGLFDERGVLKGLGRVPVNKTVPAPGRCELAVEEFWSAVRRGLTEALREASASASDIAGISYSSQATTFLLLDAQDEPLTPLIMWTDSRGDPIEPSLTAFSRTEEFRRMIGFGDLAGQAAAAKWRWLQGHEPALWARARRVMTISDYLTFELTGERVGDASTVAFLALYELVNERWWPDALREYGVAAPQFSRMVKKLDSPNFCRICRARRRLRVRSFLG